MIKLHESITIQQVSQILAVLDCELRRDGTDYVIQPATRRPHHGNQGFIKMQHHRNQFIGNKLPAEPIG